MSDFEDESRPRPSEGVRILGAEEAQAVLDSRSDTRRDPDPGPRTQELRLDDDTDTEAVIADDDEHIELDLAGEEPSRRPSRFPDEGPSWSASEAGDTPAAGDKPSGEVPPLPHWTEPPTGAVPAIFADSEDGDDDLDAWAGTASSPRFRAEGADWADADFDDDDLSDEHPRVGALAEATVVDEDEEFERDLAARRRTPRGRAAREVTAGDATAGAAAATTATAPKPRRPRPARTEADLDLGPSPSGRDLPTALVTAGVVIVVALLCFSQGTFWTTLLAAAIVGLGTLEFTSALQARGFRPASVLALIGALMLPIAAREYGTAAYPIFFGLIVVFSMLWFLWEVTPGRPLLGVATTVLGFAYVGGLGGFAGLILAGSDGVGIILGVVLCVIAYDVFGFFIGSQFGKSPIAPRVSPNKSFEGTLAGMVAAVVVGWLIVSRIEPWSPGKAAVLGLFVAAGAFLGDLCESMIKRDLGVKDFGSLLPGHGGVLDRFDSLLFCLPIAYYLALHLNIL